MFSCRTNEDIFVCLKYCLAKSAFTRKFKLTDTYARTFENSDDGDMTKLSLLLAQEMRCDMVWSSNILRNG